MTDKTHSLGLVALLLASSAETRALADEKQECGAAFEQVQSLRQQGKLVEARDLLPVCMKDACASFVREQCTAWRPEIQADLPTVVFEVKGLDGNPTTQVRVTIDGQKKIASLDGRAVEVNPGSHTYRFEIDGADPIERTLPIVQGDKNHKIEVSFEKAKPPPVTQPAPAAVVSVVTPVPVEHPRVGEGTTVKTGGIPAWPWVIGSLGLASGIVGGIFGGVAESKASSFNNECTLDTKTGIYTPSSCVQRLSTLKLYDGLAGGFAGVGGAAVIVAIIGIATAPKSTTVVVKTMPLSVTPVVGSNVGGVLLNGRF